MKKKNSIIATILAITMFCVIIPLGPTNKKTVNALSPDYEGNVSPLGQVYYFSDTEPAFANVLEYQIGLNVVYDVRPLLTNQELQYMIYSGYFWGFEQAITNTVIIEIKAIEPSRVILEKLFECLYLQGCKVMFISPYADDLGSFEYVDISMTCNIDRFTKYLKGSVIRMLDENGDFRDGTCIFIDGRFIGIDGPIYTRDINEICSNSPVFRRLLLYIDCECSTFFEHDFERSMYESICEVFNNTYLNGTGYALAYYGEDGDTVIENYVDMWEDLLDMNFSQSTINTYNQNYKNEVGEYYNEILSDLRAVGSRIIAHSNGNQYVRVSDYGSANFSTYTFDGVNDFIGSFTNLPVPYTYSMGSWHLKSEYYNFLCSIQQDIGSSYPQINRIPFIWEEDPFVDTHSGLEILLDGDMNSMCKHACGTCVECTDYEPEILDAIFETNFQSLFE